MKWENIEYGERQMESGGESFVNNLTFAHVG